MFLKRLELKGFKSFADKSVIKLEPGISSIVGPNGSGKSNICDAILWVLGERNAKELRGGVMEDVIFAGSSKRNAVSVAEVSLVLDNSDATLPIEYNEVSVSRRLYRSGENEYLINGVVSRRLDVLDILHDSGIGTDTNSIISQGHLDSILQSKPIDRRTLIEEAAGVLKHKQRKMRSLRKLEHMDNNLNRIQDVLYEIERQLKPLRIKAKRAAAYDGLVEELNELSLDLAVDDLKKIKKQWDNRDKDKKNLEQSVEDKKKDYQNKENKLNQLRNKVSNQSKEIVEYSNKQRRLNSCIDKLNSYSMLLKEKANSAEARFADISNEPGNENTSARDQLLNEINDFQLKLDNLYKEFEKHNELLSVSKKTMDDSLENYNKAQREYDYLDGQFKAHQKESTDLSQKINDASDDIVQAKAKTTALESQIEDLKLKISRQKKDIEDLEKSKNIAFDELNKINREYDKNNENLEKKTKEKNDLEQEIRNFEDELTDIKANILALERIIENDYEQSSSATKWINQNKGNFKSLNTLSDDIDIPDKYIYLAEAILGNFSQSFVADSQDITNINEYLLTNEEATGSLRIIENSSNVRSKNVYKNAASIAKKENAYVLSDEINYDNNKSIAIFSNVVVFKSSKKAINASKKYHDICCASLDGCIVFPDGRYILGSPFYMDKMYDDESSISILSYKKNLKKLKKQEQKTQHKFQKNQDKLDKIYEEISKLEKKDISLKTNMANSNAQFEINVKYFEDQNKLISETQEQLNKSIENRKALKDAYGASAPDLENFKKDLNSTNEQIKKDEALLNEKRREMQNLLSQLDIDKQKYSDMSIENAGLKERVNAADYNLNTAKNRLKTFDARKIENNKERKELQNISNMANDFSRILLNLANTANSDLKILDNNFSNINSEAANIQKETETLSKEANEARAKYDQEKDRLSNIQIDIGKLEIQVQNAVDAIDSIGTISVDKALLMPDIENREEKEEKAFKIRRRIANMGNINPDAKEEYDALKERFDFLNSQVEDLHNAKLSLSKIDKIIDERMKDDFINTFDEVNINFQEIFSILFPGGKARLELEDNNDIDNSGVEVKAQPHGKLISKMSLLSGGEKSLVALCLLFAVYKKRSTPFYILDEVEAALDDTNLRRLISYLDNLRRTTQLIMITHQRRTMEMADVLYGVSMKSDGVTKVVSQKLDREKDYNK